MRSNIDEIVQKIVDENRTKICLSGLTVCDYLISEYENQAELWKKLLTKEEDEEYVLVRAANIKKTKDYLKRNWKHGIFM